MGALLRARLGPRVPILRDAPGTPCWFLFKTSFLAHEQDNKWAVLWKKYKCQEVLALARGLLPVFYTALFYFFHIQNLPLCPPTSLGSFLLWICAFSPFSKKPLVLLERAAFVWALFLARSVEKLIEKTLTWTVGPGAGTGRWPRPMGCWVEL